MLLSGTDVADMPNLMRALPLFADSDCGGERAQPRATAAPRAAAAGEHAPEHLKLSNQREFRHHADCCVVRVHVICQQRKGGPGSRPSMLLAGTGLLAACRTMTRTAMASSTGPVMIAQLSGSWHASSWPCATRERSSRRCVPAML